MAKRTKRIGLNFDYAIFLLILHMPMPQNTHNF